MGDTFAHHRALVSVVIPTYNSASTVERALRSVAAQTYRPIEVVVVDDASQDDTVRIVSEYAVPWLRIVRCAINGGASAARNLGVEEAKGEYVAFLDSDDEWSPTKLETQVAAMEQHPASSIVACNAAIICHERSALDAGYRKGDLFNGRMPTSRTYTWEQMLVRSLVHTSCTLIRRRDIIAAGAFDTGLTVAEDWDLWLKLARHRDIRLIEDRLSTLHDIPQSLMKRGREVRYRCRLAVLEARLADQPSRLDAHTKRAITAAHCETCSDNAFAEGRPIEAIKILTHAVILARSLYPVLRKLTKATRKIAAAAHSGHNAGWRRIKT